MHVASYNRRGEDADPAAIRGGGLREDGSGRRPLESHVLRRDGPRSGLGKLHIARMEAHDRALKACAFEFDVLAILGAGVSFPASGSGCERSVGTGHSCLPGGITVDLAP